MKLLILLASLSLTSCIKYVDEYYINCAPKADTLIIIIEGDTIISVYDYEEFGYRRI